MIKITKVAVKLEVSTLQSAYQFICDITHTERQQDNMFLLLLIMIESIKVLVVVVP